MNSFVDSETSDDDDFQKPCVIIPSYGFIRELLLESGLVLDLTVGISLFTMYSKCGSLEESFSLFQKIPVKDNACWASMISGYNEYDASSLGAQVHAYITKIGLCTEPSVGSSLLTMYSKFGSIEDCCKAFNQINGPNLIAWTALIASFAQHGKGTEALKMFNLMKQKGIKPDKVTFVGVLSLVVMVVWPKKLICI
ncbi:hypothetical protein DY000_02040143 [Brassica cretica]|uniref:Pentatricopeptide repeat-containing protein n=1 Tax=Brassica cretica TaxID=69181 RepID=A0ABQ7B8E8_BRACR|nr:hypothetical protein DY000_02040143 [Brassica cretica]